MTVSTNKDSAISSVAAFNHLSKKQKVDWLSANESEREDSINPFVTIGGTFSDLNEYPKFSVVRLYSDKTGDDTLIFAVDTTRGRGVFVDQISGDFPGGDARLCQECIRAGEILASEAGLIDSDDSSY